MLACIHLVFVAGWMQGRCRLMDTDVLCGGEMKRSAGLDNAPRALCCCVLASFMLLVSPAALAQSNPVQKAEDESASKSILERMRLNGNNGPGGIFIPNLSVRDFLASYYSKDPEERLIAYAFLFGISDATEGKIWCSYYKFKSITVRETIYSGLKELDPSRYSERAAYVITEILGKNHPCKKDR